MSTLPAGYSYYTGSPSPVRAVSYNIIGKPGSTTYYYWIVANYTWGSAPPIAPLQVANAPDVLGGGNSVLLSWLVPSPQVISYTVLRTITPLFPGNSTTAVAVAITTTTVTDTGAALVAATFTPIPAMTAVTYIDGTGPTPILVSTVGMQVAGSIAASGPVSGSSVGVTGAPAGAIPSWKAYNVTLVGANWQVTAPDGTVTLVPTAAATTQDVLLTTLPSNAFITTGRAVLTSGPCAGTTTAFAQGIGIVPGGSSTNVASFGLSLHNTPSSTTFSDSTGGTSNVAVNTPEPLTVNIVTTGGNINAITGPCSFLIAVNWGVTN